MSGRVPATKDGGRIETQVVCRELSRGSGDDGADAGDLDRGLGRSGTAAAPPVAHIDRDRAARHRRVRRRGEHHRPLGRELAADSCVTLNPGALQARSRPTGLQTCHVRDASARGAADVLRWLGGRKRRPEVPGDRADRGEPGPCRLAPAVEVAVTALAQRTRSRVPTAAGRRCTRRPRRPGCWCIRGRPTSGAPRWFRSCSTGAGSNLLPRAAAAAVPAPTSSLLSRWAIALARPRSTTCSHFGHRDRDRGLSGLPSGPMMTLP